MKALKVFMLVIDDYTKPVKSVNGEILCFDSLRNARAQIAEWKRQGDTHVYGRDTFHVKQVKVRQIL